MDKAAKAEVVERLRGRFERAPAVYLTDFTGLDVKAITKLRRDVKESGGEYVVVKNRLVKLSVTGTELPDLSDGLSGPTGLAFGYEDAVTTAKVLRDFAKDNGNRPAVKLGVLDVGLLTPEDVERIAKLPPREILLAQLAGALEGPMAALATALEGKLQETVGLFEALAEKRGEAA